MKNLPSLSNLPNKDIRSKEELGIFEYSNPNVLYKFIPILFVWRYLANTNDVLFYLILWLLNC